MKKVTIYIEQRGTGEFVMDIMIDGGQWVCDRTSRDYPSESDAITSARHAVSEFRKNEEKKGSRP